MAGKDLELIAAGHLAHALVLPLLVHSPLPAAAAYTAGLALMLAGATGLYEALAEKQGPQLLLTALSAQLAGAIIAAFAASTGLEPAASIGGLMLGAATVLAALGAYQTALSLPERSEGLPELWALTEAASTAVLAALALNKPTPPIAKTLADIAAAATAYTLSKKNTQHP